ncbi:hypothetical protein BDN72DRAFT_628736 [Pluteus cervinus]|uniref:Uncharacterized protein n=1 Tax=Pluteus cervinus TaxID=181527 RepID=A0ACD3B992_9AGAR|nr:hypothetical protein BDN72DRAFT_628736 [Pluteus cervinus]
MQMPTVRRSWTVRRLLVPFPTIPPWVASRLPPARTHKSCRPMVRMIIPPRRKRAVLRSPLRRHQHKNYNLVLNRTCNLKIQANIPPQVILG